jgi:signal peptidase I
MAYRLKKSRKVLFHTYHRFCRKRSSLTALAAGRIQEKILALESEVKAKNREKAAVLAQELEVLCQTHLKKTPFQKIRDFIFGLGGALIIAILVRQMWFELYEIPSGSMRPTFKEQDRLSVSKTDFGVNLPLTTEHLYFNPALVQRNSVVIFTVENMDFRDGDTVYFYIFPGKKQLIKRLIGKPGDTLYFYGGLIYGIDASGNDISHELQLPSLSHIDHIPFSHFRGKVSTTPSSMPGIYSPVVLYQMNEPIARLWAKGPTQAEGDLYPKILSQDPTMHYDNLWGIENFAMARLLTKEQVLLFTDQDPSELEKGVLYLELRHHPSLLNAKMGYDEWNRLRPMLGISTSIIPLNESHLKTLLGNLYTGRFVVKNGLARRYGVDDSRYNNTSFLPYFPGVPNGTYEFYAGKAYAVKWQGITFELPPTHPLYASDPERIQLLFNTGIEFDTRFSPQTKDQNLSPARYAYFRDGDLYVMGAPLFRKDDPTLQRFIEQEAKRKTFSSGQKLRGYEPFIDKGPPLLPDGRLNVDIIQRYGLKVPPKSYLALGDNHASSGDSREFGFVPEGNLRGGPSLIFWPPGSRFGRPNQPPYPLWNPGRVVIWIVAGVSIAGWYMWHRRRNQIKF